MRIIPVAFAAMLIVGCGQDPSSAQQAESQSQTTHLTPSSFEVVYDIPAMIGASKAEVDAKWGTPECPPKNACVYGEMLEVYFINGKAANFTLPPTDDPRIYGFEVGDPVWSKAEDSRWEVSLSGSTVEVSSFGGHYFYVKSEED